MKAGRRRRRPPFRRLSDGRASEASPSKFALSVLYYLKTDLRAAPDGVAARQSPGRARMSAAALAALRLSSAQRGRESASDDSDDSEEDAWQASGSTWVCGECTYASNCVQSDALCVFCGCAAPAEAPPVAFVWRCASCTLDNGADDAACAACGVAAPQQRAAAAPQASVQTGERSRAWPGAPPLRRRRAAWSCAGCTLVNGGERAECAACGMPDFAGEEEALSSLSLGGGIAGGSACMACAPRRACPAHRASRLRGAGGDAEARERERTSAWLAWETRGLVPLQRADSEEEQAAALSCVDARTRAATLRAAGPLSQRGGGEEATPSFAPTANQFRDMYGSGGGGEASASDGDAGAVGFCLDTNWEVEGREPRRRVALLQAAGWRLVRYASPACLLACLLGLCVLLR